MPTCKVVKNANFTTISNYHLRDKSLSMKAKGLLTIMLSLPEDWDYTIAGLATLSADGRDSITTTIRELEDHGYVKRHQSRGEKGTFAQNEYWIYEMPQKESVFSEAMTDTVPAYADSSFGTEADASYDEADDTSDEIAEDCENDADDYNPYVAYGPAGVKEFYPMQSKPISGFPSSAAPMSGYATQRNTKELNTNQTKIRYDLMRARAEEQVEYAVLVQEYPKELLDGLIEMIVELESCQSENLLIAGAVYPREVVVSRIQKLDAECIRYILDCLREVKPQIKNMKKYLMASMFNAPATMESFIENRIAGKVFGTT